jgi:serine protease Do
MPAALPAAIERPQEAESQQRAALRRQLDQQAQVLDAQSTVLKIVAKLVGPAVVHVEADIPLESTPAYARGRQLEEAGSGVIIELKGVHYVLTNRHVVHDAAPAAIKINLTDGRLVHPTKVAQDAETDVAVLMVDAPDLVAVPVGDSDRMQIGDFVLAVGSPFGLSHSVTFGIISAKGRRDLRLDETEKVKFQDFLQTDAAINPGNSGGPLVNLRGEVIGINTAIASHSGGSEGIGFAIPSNMFMIVARQLIDTGKVTRAFLGVRMSSRAEYGAAMATELGLPRPVGAHIKSVMPDSAADTAKLLPGDVILEFDHTPIEDDNHLANLVSLTAVGKSVPLLIFRDRKPMTLTVQVGDSSRFAK